MAANDGGKPRGCGGNHTEDGGKPHSQPPSMVTGDMARTFTLTSEPCCQVLVSSGHQLASGHARSTSTELRHGFWLRSQIRARVSLVADTFQANVCHAPQELVSRELLKTFLFPVKLD